MRVVYRLMLAVVLGLGLACIAITISALIPFRLPLLLEALLVAFAPFAELSRTIVGSQSILASRALAVFLPLQVAYAFGLVLLAEFLSRQRRRTYVILAAIGLMSASTLLADVGRRARDESARRHFEAGGRAEVMIKVTDEAAKGGEIRSVDSKAIEVSFVSNHGEVLATARTHSGSGELVPTHPGADVGDCTIAAANQSACLEEHAKWCATWSPRVSRVNVTVGDCRLFNVPMRRDVSVQIDENPPRQVVTFLLSIDSRDCN